MARSVPVFLTVRVQPLLVCNTDELAPALGLGLRGKVKGKAWVDMLRSFHRRQQRPLGRSAGVSWARFAADGGAQGGSPFNPGRCRRRLEPVCYVSSR